ncbi:MAG: tetratricopeptide repeat protein [Thermodesulfobacteriota bacterium]
MSEPAKTHLKLVVPEETAPEPVTPAEVLHHIQLNKARCAWEEILRAFHPLDQKRPDIPEGQQRLLILQEIAFALSQAKRFAEAIELLLHCHEKDPRSYQVAASLGFNYYNALMSEKAREIRLGAEKARYVEEADRWLRLAEELYPTNVVDFYRHGMLYHHIVERKDSKACPLFEAALANWESLSGEERDRRHKDHKNYIKALYHLAKARMRLGRYVEAEQAARKCMEEDRETDYEEPVHKFYLLGRILLEAGREEEALGHLKNAAHMRTKRPKDYVYHTLAVCLVRLERWDEALEWLTKVPPRYMKPHMKRLAGWIHYRIGHPEQAGSLLDEALREDTRGCHLTLVVMGRIFQDLGNWEQAIECFRKANQFKRKEFLTDHDEALFGEGQCLLRMGDREGAAEVFRRVLMTNERHVGAAQALEEITTAEGLAGSPEATEIPF